MRSWILGLVAAAVLAPVAIGHAAEVDPELPRARERAGVRLVAVDLAVSRNGEPVLDLKPEEVTIREDGVPVEIVEFRAPVVAGEAAAPEAGTAPVALGPELVLIVIDPIYSSRANILRVRDALVEFLLGDGISKGARFQLAVLDRQLHLIGGLAEDPKALIPLVENLEPAFSEALVTLRPSREVAVQARPSGPLAGLDDLSPRRANRGDFLLAVFTAIANDLADRRGPKTLLWVSNGYPQDRFVERFGPREIKRWKKAAADARLTVQAVDAAGLQVPGASLGAFHRLDWMREGFMWRIAQASGGEFVDSGNARAVALEEALRADEARYLVVYEAPRPLEKRGWRSIEVSVDRPGVDVRARPGYDDRVETATGLE